jgi:hypothetical protein
MNAERIKKLSDVINNYEVDIEHGTIYSKFYNRLLHPGKNERGYRRLNLWFKGTNKYFPVMVHELVAFVGGLDITDKSINHIDGNKLNNSISNLEAISNAENVRHGYENGLLNNSGEKHYNSKISNEDVRIMRLLFENKEKTAKEISIIFGVSYKHVHGIVTNKRRIERQYLSEIKGTQGDETNE